MAQGQISENNIRISIVIPKDLKLKADQMANADGRSLSGWIRKLITDALNENKPPIITTNYDNLLSSNITNPNVISYKHEEHKHLANVDSQKK